MFKLVLSRVLSVETIENVFVMGIVLVEVLKRINLRFKNTCLQEKHAKLFDLVYKVLFKVFLPAASLLYWSWKKLESKES